ncbi:hypothetical protein AWQ21_10830 [Picosynechococcus sp. PCC 7003]|nr:hypothetical protein AWQ21_10830 [Picosynechococcus sp. PCC 7003]
MLSFPHRKTPHLHVIKLQVTTKRAAAMLGVGESTLCQAKRRGQTIYRKDDMEARYVGKGKKSFLWMIVQYR